MPLLLALALSAIAAGAWSQAQAPDQAASPTPSDGQGQTLKPLTRSQVDDLVASGLDSETLAKVVHERGIDFQPTDRYLDVLRSQGAMQTLIDALRTATPDPLSKAQ